MREVAFPQFKLPAPLHPRPLDLLALGNAMCEMIMQVADWPGAGGQRDQSIPLPVYSAGGCATNVACFAQRLGGQARLISRLGDGRYSQPLWQEYERSGVDTAFIKRIPDKEGNLVVIMTNPSGDWSVLSHMDPDLELTPADVPPEDHFAQAKLLYLDGFTLFTAQQKEAVALAIRRARQAECLIVVDASVPIAQSQPDYLAALFAQSDIVFANEFEALTATRTTTLAEAIAVFQQMGPQLAVIKSGLAGSTIITPQASGHIPAIPVEVVDTIAAGDAYLAATLVSLAQGESLAASVQRGSAAGALACRGVGSLSTWFTMAEVEALVGSHQ